MDGEKGTGPFGLTRAMSDALRWSFGGHSGSHRLWPDWPLGSTCPARDRPKDRYSAILHRHQPEHPEGGSRAVRSVDVLKQGDRDENSANTGDEGLEEGPRRKQVSDERC